MSDDSIPTRLAVLEAKTDRTERDVSNLGAQVALLSDRLDRGFETIAYKLDSTHEKWMSALSKHVDRDSEKEQRIMEKITRVQTMVKGSSIAIGTIIGILTLLENVGFIKHF
jgi:hypothetical protein